MDAGSLLTNKPHISRVTYALDKLIKSLFGAKAVVCSDFFLVATSKSLSIGRDLI